MKFSTKGLYHYRNVELELSYTRPAAPFLQPDPYFQVLILKQGTLAITGVFGREWISSPVAVWISPHNQLHALDIDITGSSESSHALIFTPAALNDPCQEEWDVEDWRKQFYFRPFLAGGEKGYSVVPLQEILLFRLDQLLSQFHRVYNLQTETEFWACMGRSCFLEILILLQRTQYRSLHGQPNLSRESDPRLDPILVYIHSHYHQPLSLKELTTCFGINRTTLNILFRNRFGIPPIGYLIRLRCDIAAGLLRKTHLGIEEISDRVGFQDPSYFGRYFRKHTGISPSHYRKSCGDPYPHADFSGQ